jgi:subtilisin family serine protease
VTAIDRNLVAYRYASRGAHIDLAAPGVDVWTAIPGRLEGPQTGTSFAVPYVTAVVAVALPEAGLTPDGDALSAKRRVLAHLRGNAKALGEEGHDPTFGAGLVQAPVSCGPAAPVTVANAAPASQPWIGTVQRAHDPAPSETPAISTWVSTVHTASEGPAR